MRAMCERSFYRTAMKSSRDAVHDHFTEDGVLTLPSPGSALPSCSGPNTVHYLFDFAQQVQYPDNPLQPGPMYFKTARKCGVFGICCEAIPRQITYLIDEASDVGKGANTVVNLLHHFFQHHNLGEATSVYTLTTVSDRTRITLFCRYNIINFICRYTHYL